LSAERDARPLSGKVLAGVLETAINRYLALWPDAPRRLSDLEGKVIALQIRGLGETLYLSAGGVGLQVREMRPDVVDVTISGTPLALLRAQTMADRTSAALGREVEISGDAELAQRLRDILSLPEIDWEEQLSHAVGDVLAHQAGNAARGLRNWTADAAFTLGQDLTEYLQEEARLVARRDEVEAYVSAVDELRMDVDRLELRVQRLANQVPSKRSGQA
jgi:ubiquinone biosynthesis protein UbiJ